MNGHICLYKFINIGNLLKSYTPSFYQFCFVGRMELEGDTLFFYFTCFCTVSVSSIKYVLLLNVQMQCGSRHSASLSPQPSSQGLCILDLHPGHKARLSTGCPSLPRDSPLAVPLLCPHSPNVLLPFRLSNPSPELGSRAALSARWPGPDNTLPLVYR